MRRVRLTRLLCVTLSEFADKDKEIASLQKTLEHLQEESLAQVRVSSSLAYASATSNHREHEGLVGGERSAKEKVCRAEAKYVA